MTFSKTGYCLYMPAKVLNSQTLGQTLFKGFDRTLILMTFYTVVWYDIRLYSEPFKNMVVILFIR